jgi:hypothetical protein
METGDQPFDDDARDELEIGNLREDLGRTGGGNGHGSAFF